MPSPTPRQTSMKRRLVCAALFTPAVHAAPLSMDSQAPEAALDYLGQLSSTLGLRITPQVYRKLAVGLMAPRQREILESTHERLRAVVGTAWPTARETVSAHVEDDLVAQRVEVVGGLSFAHTELALMLAAGSDAA